MPNSYIFALIGGPSCEFRIVTRTLQCIFYEDNDDNDDADDGYDDYDDDDHLGCI